MFIKRELLNELREHLSQKEISLIIGPRQVGKTTLMLILKRELEEKGKRTVFLNLDSELDREFFLSQEALLRKLQLELGKGRGYVFIDEIQRKENAGLFLKSIYDMNLPYKFIVSGSASFELKEKIHESLTGRKRVFELMPVSFSEFVRFKTNYRYEDKLEEFLEIEKQKAESLLNEYLCFGGYPRVVLEEKFEEKIRIIDEIYRSYLEKDISYLLKVERIDAFSSLIKILAGQIAKPLNFSELSNILGISHQTVKNYFWYAERTFIIQQLTPYFRNIRKEITKSSQVYFYDLGLRNYALGIFGNSIQRQELGFLFQNYIFNFLKVKLRYSGAKIHYWRTKDGAEVDFVIERGREVIPVEVKYEKMKMKKIKIEKSMRNFIEKYNPKQALVINLSFNQEVNYKNTAVRFLPFYKIYSYFSKI